jgi:methylglutaconyl-CoA hydratase/polyketide biosynthesis enoyl-CoA hydratase PksH
MTVRWKQAGQVARLCLAASDTGNAIDAAWLAALREAVRRLAAPGTCRAVVVESEGDAFCSGLDLAALDAGAGLARLADDYVACLREIMAAPVPFVARVEGEVLGGGLGLIAACDVVLVGPDASFMLPEVVVGMIPALVSPFLLRRLSLANLQAAAVSSRRIGAEEARALGLVDEVAADVEAGLDRLLRRLLRSSPEAIAATKVLLGRLDAPRLERDLAAARAGLAARLATPGVVAAIRRFAGAEQPASNAGAELRDA